MAGFIPAMANERIKMDKQQRQDLAKEIKRNFLRRRIEKTPGFYLSKRFDKEEYWYAAVDLCEKFHVSGDELVSAVFEYDLHKPLGFPILPMHLGSAVGKAALKDYLTMVNSLSTREQSDEKLAQIMSEQDLSTVKSYVNDSFAYAIRLINRADRSDGNGVLRDIEILRMPLYGIPAWLRVVLAPDDKEVIRNFGKEALSQLDGGIPHLKAALQDKLKISGSNFEISIIEGLKDNLERYGSAE